MLMANSAPHLATAAAGRRHLTPLAGKQSGPAINGIWSAVNIVGSVLLLRSGRLSADRAKKIRRWDDDLVAFGTGYLVFAAWMAGSERLFSTNHG
jgi:hypothetical protein